MTVNLKTTNTLTKTSIKSRNWIFEIYILRDFNFKNRSDIQMLTKCIKKIQTKIYQRDQYYNVQ